MSLSDFIAFFEQRQYLPQAKGRVVKGYAMSGSIADGSLYDKQTRYPGDREVSKLRRRLVKRGVSMDALRGMTEESMRALAEVFRTADRHRALANLARGREIGHLRRAAAKK